MARIVLSLCLAAFAVSALAQDVHLREPGSALVLSHSCFAHGYRHGYEEGYHIGNADISMGTMPRSKPAEFHNLKLGYVSQFGSRHQFEQGFQAGLKAGYRDGYSGRSFRAVDSLRSIADALDEARPTADPKFAHFDEGFFSGYHDGFDQGASGQSAQAQVDFHFVGCTNFHPAKRADSSAQESYCEGYRRGFALGHADGFVLRPDSSRLEASK